MKYGLSLLNSRLEQVEIPSIAAEVLPDLYILFFQIYDVTKISQNKFLDEYGELSQIGAMIFEHNGEIIFFNEFLSIEQIIQEVEHAKDSIEWEEKRLIRIGLLGTPGFGGLYVGCGHDSKDEVWIFNAEASPQYIKVSPNIFSFAAKLRMSSDFSDYEGDISKLIQKWGEDFWRQNDNLTMQNKDI